MQYKKAISRLVLFAFLGTMVACDGEVESVDQQNATSANVVLSKPAFSKTARLFADDDAGNKTQQRPNVKAYQDDLSLALIAPIPVLKLSDGVLNQTQLNAQTLALSSAGFLKHSIDRFKNKPYRNEIMQVRPALLGDFGGDTVNQAICQKNVCYKVEMYNFFLNLTSTALVDLTKARIISSNHLLSTQPDINLRLLNLAKEIANQSDEVRKTLGEKSAMIQPVMAEIKTALKGSRCERSKHLCVAPTYLLEDRALWVIVDLTDLRVVGLRWSELGESGPPIFITERTIQNEYVFNQFCRKITHLEQAGWQMDYHLTSSDGLKISNVRFEDKAILSSAKLVDWHVNYSQFDHFGYSDAIGCPMFSSAVVVAFDGPKIDSIMENGQEVGFAVVQDFRQAPWPAPCNYRYVQRYEFYFDGRFRLAMADYGRGCGTDGTYRPVLRVNLSKPSGEVLRFHSWQGEAPAESTSKDDVGKWQHWDKEQWDFQSKQREYYLNRFSHKIESEDNSAYFLEPSRGQFGDGGRGDHAYTYITRLDLNRDEGEQDLVTLGSCCNDDYQQGPELFMQPAEPLEGEQLVLWYVPQMKNDGRRGKEYCWAESVVEKGIAQAKVWPCYAGPMFVPEHLVSPEKPL